MAKQRANLQKNYAKGLLPKIDFLMSMGGLCLKGARAVHMILPDKQAGSGEAMAPIPEEDDSDGSGDSMRY